MTNKNIQLDRIRSGNRVSMIPLGRSLLLALLLTGFGSVAGSRAGSGSEWNPSPGSSTSAGLGSLSAPQLVKAGDDSSPVDHLSSSAAEAFEEVAQEGACKVTTAKYARPSNIELGESVEIELRIDTDCPPSSGSQKADIVLAVDRSSSQFDNGTWNSTLAAAHSFVDLIDFNESQVGIVAFGSDLFGPAASLVLGLSDDYDGVKRGLDRIPPPPALGGPTNITAAVNMAQSELSASARRGDAQPVLVLLSDGEQTAVLAGDPVQAAAAAKQSGTIIITIGLAVNAAARRTLELMATRPELYFEAPSGSDLENVLIEVAGTVGGSGSVSDLVVTDLLPSQVSYVDGSAVPAPTSIEGSTLTWRFDSVPEDGWVARYRIVPEVAGRYATNKLAYVDYLDADGSSASREFPIPFVTVREVGEQIQVFAPVVYRGYCPPSISFDLVLAIDTSDSMSGDKYERTISAARRFLDFVDMPPSQGAVVGFNSEASVVAGLGSDRPALLDALGRLPRGSGTRIDKALLASVDVLSGDQHNPDHAPVIILITDGQQQGGDRQVVLNAASAARRINARVYTIGFGDDVDPELLIRVAGDPDRFFAAPATEDLTRIYEDIAGALPCGY